MQFTVDGKSLKDALGLVAGIPGYNDRVVLMSAQKENNELRIECAGNGSYLKQEIPAKVAEAGEVNIDCDYLNGLHFSDTATFTVKGSKIYIKSGKYSYNVNTAQIDKIKDQRPKNSIDCTLVLMKEVLSKALSRSSLVPSIPNPGHGVHFVVDGDKLKVFCNDQYRGTMFVNKLVKEQKAFDVVFKLPVLQAILSKINDSNLAVGQSGGMLRLLGGTIDFYHPVLQVNSQDVEAFFGQLDYKEPSLVEITVEEFVRDVQAASSIVSNLGYECKVDLAFNGAKVDISVSSPHGEAKAEHTLSSPATGNSFNAKLSNRYLQEMLSLIGDVKVKLHFWPNVVTFESLDGSYKSAMPLITDEQ